MSYRAVIHDINTGRFLLICSVEGCDLHAAERAAITKAAMSMRAHPGDMEVRHLHQCAKRTI